MIIRGHIPGRRGIEFVFGTEGNPDRGFPVEAFTIPGAVEMRLRVCGEQRGSG